MGILSPELVLDEIGGVLGLAEIVVVRRGPGQERVGSHRPGGGVGQGADHQ